MNNRFFLAVDSWLIDKVFQVICDWIRKILGFSKRIPIALSTILTVIGAVPIIPLILNLMSPIPVFLLGISPFLILLTVWCFLKSHEAYKMIQEEFSDEATEETSALESARITGYVDRIGTLIFTMLIILTPKNPEISDVILIWFVTGVVANTCAVYFKACADLPRPPKRKVSMQSS